jgi:hypothetical protein
VDRQQKGWPRLEIVGGASLILVGLFDATKVTRFNLDWEAMALILAGAVLWFTPLVALMPRVRQLKVKGVKLILDEMPLSPVARKELSGLSAHDIWALESVESGTTTNVISKMNAAQRVAARMLVDFQLLTIAGEGSTERVDVTPLGRQLLDAAKLIPFH